MTDLIKKAVELADGLLFRDASAWYEIKHNYDEQAFLDALAAQLVRQVDAASKMGMSDIYIWRLDRDYGGVWPIDRTMENIEDCVKWLTDNKAIVDSGAL